MLKSPSPADSKVLTVSQLNRLARQLLEDHFPLVSVQGEISNFAQPASGHWYLTLKDQNAQVRCAMFRNRNFYVRFKPKDGTQVIVKARLSLYEGRGDYQLLVESMEEAGAGALRQAFEQLYARLHAEGLFAPERKRPLPVWPRHVAVITSPTGAAVRDVISVFGRRFPATRLTIVPVSVQGLTAAQEMVMALTRVNERQGCLADVDTILLTRGGGSLEDLWSYNDESLARVIATSALPVVSAVGHEIDFTIADYVADARAATPSAAAELLSPHQDVIRSRLHNLLVRQSAVPASLLAAARKHLLNIGKRLRHPGQRLQQQSQQLDMLELRLRRAANQQQQQRLQTLNALVKRLQLQRPDRLLRGYRQDLITLSQQLLLALRRRLSQQKQKLAAASHSLNTVSPLNTLARGYSLTTADGHVITHYDQVQPGATIHTHLAEGSIHSTVIGTAPEKQQ